MSGVTFPLNSLPTEVLLCVLETLPRGDLYSLCLVSRGYDMITAPLLYKAVEWNDGTTRIFRGSPSLGFGEDGEYKPCLAFKRRPILRNYVQSVTFYSRRPRWADILSDEQIKIICKQLSRLRSVYVIRWGFRNIPRYSSLNKVAPFIKVMAKLRTLRELHMPCIINAQAGYLDALTQPFKAISVGTFLANDFVPLFKWITKKQDTLRELHILAHSRDETKLEFFTSFRGLQQFSHDIVTHFPSLVTNLREMKQLRGLRVGISVKHGHSWSAVALEPVRLTELRSLKIEIRQDRLSHPDYYNTAATAIFNWYISLAAHSNHLETLHICSVSPKAHPNVQGDKLLLKIIHDHKEGIRSLRVDDMMARRETLMRLFSQCTRLEELGLKIISRSQSLTSFYPLRSLAVALQYLNLTFPRENPPPKSSEVECFLLQGMPRLRRLQIHAFEGFPGVKDKPEYVRWESKCLYDEELGALCRYVSMEPGFYLWGDSPFDGIIPY